MFSAPIRALNRFTVNAGGWSSFNQYPRQLADINGDGNADIVGFGGNAVFTALSNGDGTFQSSTRALNRFTINAGGWSSFDKYPRQLADINGDGNADIVGFGHNTVFTALSNGDGTFQASTRALNRFAVNAGGWSSFEKYPRQLADINGDGNADIVGFGHNAVFTALSNGDGTFQASTRALNRFAVNAGGWSSFEKYPRQLADINGDGNADIIGFGGNAVFTALSNGDGTFQSSVRSLNHFAINAGGWSSFNQYPRHLADINGDGNADIVGFSENAVYTSLSDGNFTPAPPPNRFNIQFDYRFDTNGWFTTERRALLETAAGIWENIILDEFPDTPVGTATPLVINPQTGATINTFTTDRVIDDLLIFPGARNLGSQLGVGGPSGWFTNESRYVGNDFEPWIGSITFNTNSNWFLDPTPNSSNDIPFNQSDFLTLAIHEIGHVLGWTSGINAFNNFVSNGSFNGPQAKARNGGNPIPLADNSHIQDGYTFGGIGESVMDPILTSGTRKRPTVLDVAVLDDIGYDINYSAAFRNT